MCQLWIYQGWPDGDLAMGGKSLTWHYLQLPSAWQQRSADMWEQFILFFFFTCWWAKPGWWLGIIFKYEVNYGCSGRVCGNVEDIQTVKMEFAIVLITWTLSPLVCDPYLSAPLCTRNYSLKMVSTDGGIQVGFQGQSPRRDEWTPSHIYLCPFLCLHARTLASVKVLNAANCDLNSLKNKLGLVWSCIMILHPVSKSIQ